MNNPLNAGLKFQLSGKFAQFKKYYSNSSSFTYELPPRTAILGIVGSILNLARDSYYNDFTPELCKVAVSLGTKVRTFTQCVNYLKNDGGRTQVRLQLLASEEGMIQYNVYLFHNDLKIIDELSDRIKQANFGYGLYFGQRPFRAYAKLIDRFVLNDLEVISDYKGSIESATFLENVQFNDDTIQDIECVSMPIHFMKEKEGRKPSQTDDIVYERTDGLLHGTFKKVIKFNGKCISPFTKIND